MDILWYLLGKKAGSLKLPVIPPDAGTLTSIVVGNLPDKTTYTEGEALDLTGLVILGQFSNGYEIDVTNGCTFICNDPVTYYDTKITAKYVVVDTEKTIDIPITVNGVSPEAPAETKGLWHFDDGTDKNDVNGKGTSTSGLVDPIAFAGSSIAVGKFSSCVTNRSSAGVWFNYNNSLGLTKYSNADIATTELTFECWVKCSSVTSNNQFVIQFSNSDNNSTGVTLQFYNTIQIQNASSYWFPGGTSTQTPAENNKWYHFAFVINNGVTAAYLDGKKMVQSTTSSFPSAAALSYIKIKPSSSLFCDEVLITETVKYLADFEPPHAPYHLAQGGE